MKTVIVRTTCQGTIRERWTLTAPDELAAHLAEHPDEALDAMNSGAAGFVDVTDETDDEHDREILGVEIFDRDPA